MYSNAENRQSAYRFAVLAMSLASLFDIQTPSEYLKALTALMTEYEAFQDETQKPKVRNWLAIPWGPVSILIDAHPQAKKRNLFRASKVPKRHGGSEYAGATYDASDNYLLTPNIVSVCVLSVDGH